MSIAVLTNMDYGNNQILNVLLQSLSTDPSSVEAKIYYNNSAKEIRFYNGTSWVALSPVGGGGGLPSGTVPAGDLVGSSYPSPTIANGKVVSNYMAANTFATGETINSVAGTATSGTPAMRAIGTGANQAMAGNTTLNAITAPTASVNLSNQKITSLGTPTADTDAATKVYVDNLVTGLDAKPSVKAATTANITISTALNVGDSIDGVTLAADDRVLVKDQTTGGQNGIYVVSASPARSADMDTWAEVPSSYVWVEQGTVNGDTGWVCTADSGGTLNSTVMTWVLFSSAGTFIAGDGLTKVGNTINLVSATADATVTADNFTIVSAPKWTTSRTLNLTGDVTGSVSFDGGSAIGNLATTNATMPKFYAGDVGSGTAPVITHNLGSRDVNVQVYLNSGTYETVLCDVERTSTNTVTLRFATAVTAAAYRCVVTGR